MEQTTRVCPECGQAAGAQPFCASCGKNLASVDRLPTREEWGHTHAPAATKAATSEEPFTALKAPASPSLWAAPEAPTGAAGASRPAPGDTDDRAAWGYRVGAWVIDASAAVALGLLVGLAVKQSDATPDTVDTLTGLSVLAGWVLVTAGLSAVTDGQSLGKWIAGLRVVRKGRGPAGFWWIVLRDTVCSVLFVIPLVFLINALAPLGSERRSLIDRMVKTDVVASERIGGRVPAILAAAVVGIGAWVGLAAASGDTFSTHYTRDEFIADCTDGGGGNLTCGCIYDDMAQDLSRDDLDAMRTAAKASDVSTEADASLNRSIAACAH